MNEDVANARNASRVLEACFCKVRVGATSPRIPLVERAKEEGKVSEISLRVEMASWLASWLS